MENTLCHAKMKDHYEKWGCCKNESQSGLMRTEVIWENVRDRGECASLSLSLSPHLYLCFFFFSFLLHSNYLPHALLYINKLVTRFCFSVITNLWGFLAALLAQLPTTSKGSTGLTQFGLYTLGCSFLRESIEVLLSRAMNEVQLVFGRS
jgi:hypothetical protein